MRKQKKSMLVLATITVFMATAVFFPGLVRAGDQSQILPANDGDSDGCNSSRFECVMGGEAVLDKKTGLTWAKNANIAAGAKTWLEAVRFCQNLMIGHRKGWRLPTIKELSSLLDPHKAYPFLPEGHPFENVCYAWGIQHYWSSTTYEGDSSRAWVVTMHYGKVTYGLKVFDSYVWPVRGDN